MDRSAARRDFNANSTGASREDESTAAQWQAEWLGFSQPIVPVMVLPDGYVSRGLGALARLAQLAVNGEHVEVPDTTVSEAKEKPMVDPSDLGGESPCFAHLLEKRAGSLSAQS